jgi:sialate O-acetylesterase
MKTKKTNLKWVLFAIIMAFMQPIVSQVKLPRLISDGMVLQRDTKLNIWGWASAGEQISLEFRGKAYQTTATEKGDWKIELDASAAGGPFQMIIKGNNTITLNNILVGDVWVCSGQSNMELPMRRVSWVYPEEMEGPGNDKIRQFAVPQRYNFHYPETDLPWGTWKSATQANLSDFSAVAYFFAKEMYAKTKVPIGIINTSLGGSPAEAWMSGQALQKFPNHYNEAIKFRDSLLIREIERKDNERSADWYRRLNLADLSYTASEKPWYHESTNTTDWEKINVPGYWYNTPLEKVNGSVWFVKKIRLSKQQAGQKSMIELGRLVDADSVFINGRFVGTVSYQYPPRRYTIPGNLLREGENTITIRLISNTGTGGFVPDKNYALVCGKDTIDLKGEWQYKIGARMEPLQGQTFIRWKPMGLFNAMIAPLLEYRMKGVIWYQGESNAGRPKEYRELFPDMINDWRNHFKQGNFPFVFVQLASFMEPRKEPSESHWALLREAQLLTLNVPNTGMAVAIDIGEWNDVHPLNKKEVGIRLAHEAQRLCYDKNLKPGFGPRFTKMELKGNVAVLTFSNSEGKLAIPKTIEIKGFAIAGEDKKFVWARAVIKKNKVHVWHPGIKNPIAVRYAWADFPEGINFYNVYGFPVSPFRTDDW